MRLMVLWKQRLIRQATPRPAAAATRQRRRHIALQEQHWEQRSQQIAQMHMATTQQRAMLHTQPQSQ
jgi:hypothetical protein